MSTINGKSKICRNLRMEVRLNNELLCRAGTTRTLKFLTARLQFYRSRNLRPGMGTVEFCSLVVNSTHKDAEPGICGSGRTHWVNVDIREGDEITIKLVKHGAITEPLGMFPCSQDPEGGNSAEDNRCDLKSS